jgi:hypothetical protein
MTTVFAEGADTLSLIRVISVIRGSLPEPVLAQRSNLATKHVRVKEVVLRFLGL